MLFFSGVHACVSGADVLAINYVYTIAFGHSYRIERFFSGVHACVNGADAIIT
jgi:hypothetical protein